MGRNPVLLAAALLLFGCRSAPRTDGDPGGGDETPRGTAEAAPRPPVDKLDLQSAMTVVNLDAKPGADGVYLGLRLWRVEEPLAVVLDRGTVEFLIYDGRIPPTELDLAEPLRVVTLSASELRRFVRPSAVGPSYTLPMAWGENAPESGVITVSARLLRPGRRPLYAEPVNLAVGPR